MKKNAGIFLSAAVFLTSFVIAASVFRLCYEFDNKYTLQGSQPMAGVLLPDESIIETDKVLYLVRDWELYRNTLLSPEDFVRGNPLPDEYVFIGQYGGMEGDISGSIRRSPHGSATYRLNIVLPSEPQSYTLELPEIYSAYRLYINGELQKEMGIPDHENYRPETGIYSVTVHAANSMEILIAVSDYSHIYSGMVYPPAFGETDAVKKAGYFRIVLRTAVCAAALCVGFLYLLVGILNRKKNADSNTGLPFLYSALSLAYTLIICYPVVKTLQHGGMLFYFIESLAWCAMLFLVILIQQRLCGLNGKWSLPFHAFAIFVCCWALLIPLLMGDSLFFMMTYSRLIDWYSWIGAVYLTVCTIAGIIRKTLYSRFMLAGTAVLDAALVMDRFYPLYEPIYGGWFAELAGGFLIFLIGIVMSADVARQFQLRQALETRITSVSKMLEVQQAYHANILNLKMETQKMQHDLRHHISVMRELVEDEDTEGLRKYLDKMGQHRVSPANKSFCPHYMTDTLLRMYAGLAVEKRTALHIYADVPKHLAMDDMDLCIVLSNLLENALEASLCLPEDERQVTVMIGLRLRRLVIIVENRFDGHFWEKDGHIFSRKGNNRKGIGLSSVRSVAVRAGGHANFYVNEQGLFCCEVFIPIAKVDS